MAKATAKSYLPGPAKPKVVPWLWSNEMWQSMYPALFELLAAGIYEGDARKPATLTLFVSESRLKACIRDRQTRQTLWLTLEGTTDVLGEVEHAIQENAGEWRADRKGDGLEGVL